MPKTTVMRSAHLNTRRATNITAPATEYLALFTAAPTEAGGGTEVAVGAYARQVVAFAAPAADQISNSALIQFPVATADYPGDVLAWGTYDAVTAGTLRDYGYLGGILTTFTALAATDIFTSVGHAFADAMAVVLTGTALPTGVTAGTKYFVRDIVGDTFKLAATSGGVAIDITTNGAGHIQKDLRRTVLTGDRATFAIGDVKVSEK